MFFDGYSMKASMVASRKVHRDMLEFAAYHSIHLKIETFALNESGVRAALERLQSGGMRYRGVLVATQVGITDSKQAT